MSTDPYRPQGFPMAHVRRLVRRARWVRLRMRNPGAEIRVGDSVAVGPGARLFLERGLWIADEVAIGADFHCAADVEIGTGTLISSRVSLVGNDHQLGVDGLSPYRAPRRPAARIVIGRNVFVGFGATIVGPVTVGDGAVIGAHALVLHDVPAGATVVGNPARVVRQADGST